ncbi:DUF2231 domain-containing protein [Arenimonas composti]|uniref:DUF2231 domain-containing protein n=1 Tax=Arenimonas composti TR7-09 = DSM 18010 TaxID=1121013 RepID=A0A091BCN7_9GAMM|nr:DUF2231 domain-containing protein [Arenimonas composti]KFN49476.1 hypothetical protein P873_10915 [Arenimonas composti TR7-09 = DSM 18010]
MQMSPGRTHAFLLAAAVPLHLGVLLNDWAYRQSHQIQWANFASWLLVGALVVGAAALVFAIVDLVRHRDGGTTMRVVLQAALWILGFVNALVHARDAWAVMPTGLVLSALSSLLAVIAGFVVFAALPPPPRPVPLQRTGGTP